RAAVRHPAVGHGLKNAFPVAWVFAVEVVVAVTLPAACERRRGDGRERARGRPQALADHDRGGAILVIENDVPGVGLDLNLLLLRHPLLPPRTGWTHPAPIQRRGHIRTGSSCRQRSRGAPRNDPAP